MLKQAGNHELKNTTHNTIRACRVHLNAFSRQPFSKQLFYLDQMSSGVFFFKFSILKVGHNHSYWLTEVDKVFYFILCVGYIASEEVERGEKENWPAKQALRSLEEN